MNGQREERIYTNVKKGLRDQKPAKNGENDKIDQKRGHDCQMAYFSLKENSYEKRKCFFWLLVRVNSVDQFIFDPRVH